jgi:CheY-like chemotaxis protein
MSQDMPSDAIRPVLVIEDHLDTRQMVETFLQIEGIATIGAANGLQGLAALREHVPAVILLDLTMPVMDGWRFREEQRRLADALLASIPVVVLSALNDCRQHARALGAVDVIPKPIDFDRLIEIVRRYC